MSLTNAVYAYKGNIVGAGGNAVFTVGNGEAPLSLRMSFNNETPASADGTIYLEANDSVYDGTYDIMWGDANGVMSNYSKIESLTVAVDDEKPTAFIKLMSYNAIPKYATRLCAVKNNEIAVSFDIPSSKLWSAGNYGEHLYSFGLLSDLHVQYQTGHDDVHVAMTYLNEREGVDAICISGDLTQNGSVANLDEWKTDRDTWADNTPVYSCNGNHEAYNSSAIMVTAPDTIRPYLDSDYTESTGTPYFYKVINNDVFVFVAIFENNTPAMGKTMFSADCLAWLETLLEQYRNQRVFLFAHIPPHSKNTQYSGFGLGNMAYSNDLWGYSATSDRSAFMSLLQHYKNVIWFSGHSHIKYEYQKLWDKLNVDKYYNGTRFVHVSSLTVPRDIIDGNVTNYIYAESEGAVVDVYTNCIRVRNRNFVGEKFYGLCEYLIDTTPTIIPPAQKTVVSIAATKTKTAYYTDETLSTSDITVTATYSDDSTENVSSSAVFNTSAVTLSIAGTYTIGVSYTYEGDTVTTSVQVTSQARPTRFIPLFDATFTGTLTEQGGIILNRTPNNEMTTIFGNTSVEVRGDATGISSYLNKPLYYRLISDIGISESDKIGFVGALRLYADNTIVASLPDYVLTESEWTPLIDRNNNQLSMASTQCVRVLCKASSSSPATFPVSVNTRLQIGVVDDTPEYTYTPVLDATFAGEFTGTNQTLPKDAITANNNKTILSGTTRGFALCMNSAILGKPLYYRLVTNTGISPANGVGFKGAASATTGVATVPFTDYSLGATEWTPLMQHADPTQQIVVSSPNDRIWLECKANSSSTATFPVTVDCRIQIGYRDN